MSESVQLAYEDAVEILHAIRNSELWMSEESAREKLDEAGDKLSAAIVEWHRRNGGRR